MGSFEHSHRDFAWEYLGGAKDQSKARETILNLDHWDRVTTPNKMDFAVHVLLRYRLLDILANVLGCEIHSQKKVFAQVPHPPLPTRVDQVNDPVIFGHRYSKATLAPYLLGKLASQCGKIRSPLQGRGTSAQSSIES
jgi:hypothetical protein